MSTMHVYSETSSEAIEVFEDPREIGLELLKMGIHYERWTTSATLAKNPTDEEVLEAFNNSVERIKEENDFATADIVSLHPDHPQKDELRKKFLSEHTHKEDEVRFFVEGQGLFYLHLKDKVYGVRCNAGDYLSIPANTPHWFDMGGQPNFRCIRFFTDSECWVAHYTGSDIADNYPLFE